MPRTRASRGPRALRVAFAGSLVGVACGVPEHAGFDYVNDTAMERTGYAAAWTRGAEEDAAANALTAELLGEELTLENAVKVALLNNRGLQATFEQLGVQRGQLIQASLPMNPVFAGNWRVFERGLLQVLTLHENLISVITIPLRRDLEGSQLEATIALVTAQVVRLVADVKRAYIEYQVAKEMVKLAQTLVKARKGAYMIADRLQEAGNISQRRYFIERIPYEDSKVRLNAQVEQLALARERMNVVMGLWAEQTSWETPDAVPAAPVPEGYGDRGVDAPPGVAAIAEGQLPPVALTPKGEGGDVRDQPESFAEDAAEAFAGPPTDEDVTDPSAKGLGPAADQEVVTGEIEPSEERFERIERLAVERSLDLLFARELVDAQGARLKLNVILAAFPFLNVGGIVMQRLSNAWGAGPLITSPVPLIDFGQAQAVTEGSRLRLRVEDYKQLAITIRATARASETRVIASRERALYHQRVLVPMAAAFFSESYLQYNAVNLDPITLLENKERQIVTSMNLVLALRDYWFSRIDLEQLLDGALPLGVL